MRIPDLINIDSAERTPVRAEPTLIYIRPFLIVPVTRGGDLQTTGV